MTPGTGPEGFAISPDGKWVAAALLGGLRRETKRLVQNQRRRTRADVARSDNRRVDREVARAVWVACPKPSRSARRAITFMSAIISMPICRYFVSIGGNLKAGRPEHQTRRPAGLDARAAALITGDFAAGEPRSARCSRIVPGLMLAAGRSQSGGSASYRSIFARTSGWCCWRRNRSSACRRWPAIRRCRSSRRAAARLPIVRASAEAVMDLSPRPRPRRAFRCADHARVAGAGGSAGRTSRSTERFPGHPRGASRRRRVAGRAGSRRSVDRRHGCRAATATGPPIQALVWEPRGWTSGPGR